nr:hypothetical protein Iba_chr01cCG10920 [Ipomoea batatas]GMC55741.1 hypothetical protein Iba_chr01fCG0580 [Ipomoea batatas]GME20664.1 hypothetical protein Iba_scaffold25786CG0010 [Ipomoea batatas]
MPDRGPPGALQYDNCIPNGHSCHSDSICSQHVWDYFHAFLCRVLHWHLPISGGNLGLRIRDLVGRSRPIINDEPHQC